MKMRIQGDSVRLRVSVSEVQRLGGGHSVACRTRFPGGAALGYRLEGAEVDAIDARFDGATVTVRVPLDALHDWSGRPDLVSLSGRADLGDGELTLLVEKDFACLNPRPGEDDGDRFVNPGTTAEA
tara:strand:- start:8042 stop:8419 length:378 start_codon:yes stop_codon:yes gene_type:complete